MEILSTRVTPYIRIDEHLSELEISGISNPRDSQDFYQPILSSIINFVPKRSHINVSFHLEYANTASYKWLFLICKQLSNFLSKGYKIQATWHYDLEDDDMKQLGEEFAILSGLQFSFHETELTH
ncbi:MAG: DUF1987 domain-containing protein [bacterium]|nr:DUF1987 domain-containing protein [bacterium]